MELFDQPKSFKPWQIVLLLVIFIIFVVLRFVSPTAKPRDKAMTVPSGAVAMVGSVRIPVMVANTPELAYQGLSDRQNLGEYGGMLFMFPTAALRTFVMRRMLFPLDIVWITDGAITDISAHLPLEPGVTEQNLIKYAGREPVTMVLEVASGTVERMGWKIGDSVTVQY
jgi:uncharacterized membrane protein (UPF0127 family)